MFSDAWSSIRVPCINTKIAVAVTNARASTCAAGRQGKGEGGLTLRGEHAGTDVRWESRICGDAQVAPPTCDGNHEITPLAIKATWQ